MFKQFTQNLRLWLNAQSHEAVEARRRRDDRASEYHPSDWFEGAWPEAIAGKAAAFATDISSGRDADSGEVACLLAAQSLARADPTSALEHARIAVASHENFAAAHQMCGRSLSALGQHAAALESYRRLVELRCDDPTALAEQAAAHLALDQLDDARDFYQTALAHDAAYIPALLGLARLQRIGGELESALNDLNRALSIVPSDPVMHLELALTLNAIGDTAGAHAAYKRALDLDPGYAAANVNLGLIYLTQLGDAESARRHFECAVASEPGLVAAQANLGLALEACGRSGEALAHYEALIARYPDIIEYRWNRAIALLTKGDFRHGWPDYELRNQRGRNVRGRAFPFPVWDGDRSIKGALLIYAEQGIGDEIMFASCISDLLNQGVRCVIECNQRLASLFARSFPSAHVHGAARDGNREWLTAFRDIDAQVAMGSLPALLRTSEQNFPAHTGYLHADPLRIKKWRDRLSLDAGQSHTNGLSWRGGTTKTRSGLRSIELKMLEPLIALPGAKCINLQRGAKHELDSVQRAPGMQVLAYDKIGDDIEETAALIQALDCVVTVDNTIAHLVGALGKRGMLMLEHHADWRWLTDRSTSPWYPSLTLCRQDKPGDWKTVLDAVASMLH